jgi:2-polyprenyl-6-methoxyphenol hydroxylase-like FAD-dependent oxidoreductase
MNNKSVLISGAGVAGLALAYWLRGYGFAATVVERAPAPRGGGYDVDFRGPALDVLDRMGILDEVRECQTPRRGTTVLDGDGQQVAVLPAEWSAGDLEIRKGDLTNILHAAVKTDVHYIFDNSTAALTQRHDGVRVSFERGEPQDFDLVVGADGVHSNVRTLVFGPEGEFIRHLGMASAGFTTTNYLNLDNHGLLYRSPRVSAGVMSGRGNTEISVFLSFTAESLNCDRNDIDQQKKLVDNRLAGHDWEIPRLLAAMRNAPDFYFDIFSQIYMDSWAKDRVALLGDAAYCAAPTSGRGTSQALIGAYILAGELATVADHEEAFAAYEQQMRAYIAENQRIGQEAARWFLRFPAETTVEAGVASDQEPIPVTITLKNYSYYVQ